MNRRIAVRGIITLENKILAVQQKPYNAVSSSMNGAWCVPGGGLDPGEPIVEGVIREIFEETGVTAHVGELLFIQQFVHKDTEQLELFFHITNGADFLGIDLNKTSHGAAEIEVIEFIDPKATNVLPTFLQEIDIAVAIAAKQPTQVFNYI